MGVSDGATHLPVDGGVLDDDQSDTAARTGPVVLDEPFVDFAESTGELRKDRSLDEAVAQGHLSDSAGAEKRPVLSGMRIGGIGCGHGHGHACLYIAEMRR